MATKQGTISFVSGGAGGKIPKAVKKGAMATRTSPEAVEPALRSTDPRVQAFYNQLSPAEVVAHTIAVDKLGTSYDVTRTHGFVKWSKAHPPA